MASYTMFITKGPLYFHVKIEAFDDKGAASETFVLQLPVDTFAPMTPQSDLHQIGAGLEAHFWTLLAMTRA